MAAPAIWDVMEAITAKLRTITGLRVWDFKTDRFTPPAAFVEVPGVLNYRETFGAGQAVMRFQITVMTSTAVDRAGQKHLAELASSTGDRSVFAAFDEDTLDGLVHGCVVQSFEPLDEVEVNGEAYFGGRFMLLVYADGNAT